MFVLDPAGRLLLLDSADPGAPPDKRWWELPGGGVENGETAAEAGVREVLEETGVSVPLDAVGPCRWRQDTVFTWRGARHEARCEGRLAHLSAPPSYAPVVLTGPEVGTILGIRWWTPAELEASRERFFPRHVPALLQRLRAGEDVHEPPDDWDVEDDGDDGGVA